jgi:hypothetical protein
LFYNNLCRFTIPDRSEKAAPSLYSSSKGNMPPVFHTVELNRSLDIIRKMEIDKDKIDDAILALLYLTVHDGVRAWKTFDWEAMNRLHKKGFISNPVAKSKSVVLTDEGLLKAERLFQRLFTR